MDAQQVCSYWNSMLFISPFSLESHKIVCFRLFIDRLGFEQDDYSKHVITFGYHVYCGTLSTEFVELNHII